MELQIIITIGRLSSLGAEIVSVPLEELESVLLAIPDSPLG